MNEQLIRDTKEYIKELFSENSDGHDLDHSLRVYSNAMIIAGSEQNCDTEAVALAALLHDADDHKLFDTKDNANAVSFLKRHGVDENRIRFIVSSCRTMIGIHMNFGFTITAVFWHTP